MDSQDHNFPSTLRALARRSRMLCALDVSSALEMTHEEVVLLMDSLTASGLLRKTTSKAGRIFYWVADSSLLAHD